MVNKIHGDEYLKRYGSMTAEEQSDYESRVGQWLSNGGRLLARCSETFEARLQNVGQVSTGWNDTQCKAFEEGAVLMSALIGQSDTWLPDMLYAKAAKRAIKQMFQVLWQFEEKLNAATAEPATDAADNSHEMHVENAEHTEAKEVPAEGTVQETQAVAPFQDNAADGGVGNGDHETKNQVANEQEPITVDQGVVPARPKHIDQYVHLLPQKTQEHAALVQGLYRELEEARQKMALLMDDKTANPADREAWAKKATKCDNTLRKIFDELDAEWAKLVKSGRVVVDDLGNARVLPDCNPVEPEPVELTSQQRHKRRELRKWLTDTRRGNGAARDERVKQWKEKFTEYLTLEGDDAFKDEKILEAAKHYEIDMESFKKM